jgi:hypothetical protein
MTERETYLHCTECGAMWNSDECQTALNHREVRTWEVKDIVCDKCRRPMEV